jgi:hypothetical protein
MRFSRGKVIKELVGPLIAIVFETLTLIRAAKLDGEVSDEEIERIASEAAGSIAAMILDHVN